MSARTPKRICDVNPQTAQPLKPSGAVSGCASVHTPGDWMVTHHAVSCLIQTAHGFDVPSIAEVITPRACLNAGETPESRRDANARLIAAAPELLELATWVRNKARTLQAWKLGTSGHEVTIAELDEFERKAEAALAKAEGKSHA